MCHLTAENKLNGFGDIINAYRLAEGIRRTGHVGIIRLLFESDSDLERLRTLMPDMPVNFKDLQYFERNGIVFINGKNVNKDHIIKKSKVTIVSSLMMDGEEVTTRKSGINIYLQEYDGARDLKRPGSSKVALVGWPEAKAMNEAVLKENIMKKDSKGNWHWVVPTGLHSEMGIYMTEVTDDVNVTTDKNLILKKLKEVYPGVFFRCLGR